MLLGLDKEALLMVIAGCSFVATIALLIIDFLVWRGVMALVAEMKHSTEVINGYFGKINDKVLKFLDTLMALKNMEGEIGVGKKKDGDEKKDEEYLKVITFKVK